MKCAKKYSHLNGEEYLLVHHPDIYSEINSIIESLDAATMMTKVSKEKKMPGAKLFSPVDLNRAFSEQFKKKNWSEKRYSYYITLNRDLMQKSINLPAKEQKAFLLAHGEKEPIFSYNQTDFVKEKIAVEVQFGKYAFVAYDLFVKHMLFYSGGLINLGIEILPTKKMQLQMSSGIGYFEGEVYNIMRHGRNNPAVPLLIMGIEP